MEDYDPENDDYNPDSPEYSTKVKTGRKIPNVSGTLLHIKDTGYFKATFALDLLRWQVRTLQRSASATLT